MSIAFPTLTVNADRPRHVEATGIDILYLLLSCSVIGLLFKQLLSRYLTAREKPASYKKSSEFLGHEAGSSRLLLPSITNRHGDTQGNTQDRFDQCRLRSCPTDNLFLNQIGPIAIRSGPWIMRYLRCGVNPPLSRQFGLVSSFWRSTSSRSSPPTHSESWSPGLISVGLSPSVGHK